MEKIKVIITGEHRLLRESLAARINTENNFHVIGESTSLMEAMNMMASLNPAIWIMDMNMDRMKAVEDATIVLTKYPGLKIIGISREVSIELCKQFFKAGANAYLTRNSTYTELMTALIEVLKHRKYTCNEINDLIAQKQLGHTSGKQAKTLLTEKEKEIIRYLSNGLSSREIALQVKSALKTVERHRYNMLKKLGLHNTASLLTYIHRNNTGIQ